MPIEIAFNLLFEKSKRYEKQIKKSSPKEDVREATQADINWLAGM